MRRALLLGVALAVFGCRDGQSAAEMAPARVGPPERPAAQVPAAPSASTSGATAERTSAEIAATDPWESPAACRELVDSKKLLPRPSGVARLGTFNIRWFPEGHPGKKPKGEGTDIAWLACAIAWLQVDVLALQEIKGHPRGREKLQELTRSLDALTGGGWEAELDRCPAGAVQHVGLLFDSKKVKARDFTMLGSLNPYGDACKNNLRPGFSGYFVFPGGLDAHVVSVHFKSGSKRRSFDLRQRSVDQLPMAYRELQAVVADTDVVVAGDFNTMGCPTCSPKELAPLELFSKKLGALDVRFRRVTPNLECSEYYRGTGGLLDHFVVTDSMQELPRESACVVSGFCGRAACRKLDRLKMPAAYDRLSDHCPLVVDLKDQDLD